MTHDLAQSSSPLSSDLFTDRPIEWRVQESQTRRKNSRIRGLFLNTIVANQLDYSTAFLTNEVANATDAS